MEIESGPASAVTAPSQAIEDDDSELKDLVTQTLQSAGILGRIKAELRSSVYLALESGRSRESKESRLRKRSNEKLAGFLATSEGRLALHLVKEFLAFFDLNFTLSVLEPEADAPAPDGRASRASTSRSRQDLIDQIGLAPEMVDTKHPLISQIIRLSKVSVLKSDTPSPTEFIEDSHRTDVDSFLNPSSTGPPPPSGRGMEGLGGAGGSANPTPTLQSLTTPESSLNLAASAYNSASLERIGSTKPEPQAPPKNHQPSAQVTQEHTLIGLQSNENKKSSFLGDLPPLGSSQPQKQTGSLPPIKKSSKDNSLDLLDEILGKPMGEASQGEQRTIAVKEPPSKMRPEKTSEKIEVAPVSEEEIDEEIEFSEDISISAASEGFTKDESLRNEALFKADYVESLE